LGRAMSWRTGFKEPAKPTRIAKKKRISFPRIKLGKKVLTVVLIVICIAAGFGAGTVVGHTLLPKTITSIMFVPRYHVITKTLTHTFISTRTLVYTRTIVKDIDHPRIYSAHALYQILNGLPVIKVVYSASAPFLIRIEYPNNKTSPLIVASPRQHSLAIPIAGLCSEPPLGTYRIELLDYALNPLRKPLTINVTAPSLSVYLSQYFVSSSNPRTVTELTLSIVNTGGNAFIHRIVIEFINGKAVAKTIELTIGCLAIPSMHSKKIDLRINVTLPSGGHYMVYVKMYSSNKLIYSGTIGSISVA